MTTFHVVPGMREWATAHPRCALLGYLKRHAMNYAIYRTEKLKSISAIRASVAHNSRSRMTPNADALRTGKNRQLLGFAGVIPSPADFVAEWERATAAAARKPNAVLLQEIFVGTSPEFFAESESFDQRLVQWERHALNWLCREFGDNLFSATLHLDETTPHIAAYVVPLMLAKDGSVWLSAKKIFNPRTLVQHQDRYAQSVSVLGLQRGVRGSVAEHRSIRSYYGKVVAAQAEQDVDRSTESPFLLPDPIPSETPAAHAARVLKGAEDRVRVVGAEADRLRCLAAEAATSKRTEKALRKTNEKLSSELAATKTNMRNLTDLVRDIPLPDVLFRLGWGEGRREGGALTWRTGEHVITVNGPKWYDHKAGKGGGKSIDLVMHLMACNFTDAVGWLAGQWTSHQVSAAVRVAANQLTTSVPKKSFPELWDYYARPDHCATAMVRTYLVSVRGLLPEVVDLQIDDRRLHGSFQRLRGGGSRPWCVFPHVDARGATLGATLRALDDEDQPKRCLGDKGSSFFSVGPLVLDAEELVFVESPIDALSYFQRSQRARVVSVAGSVIPDSALTATKEHSLPISVALDGDAAGQNGWLGVLDRIRDWGAGYLGRLRRVTPKLSGWELKDWNELVRAEQVEKTAHATPPDDPESLPSAQTSTQRVGRLI